MEPKVPPNRIQARAAIGNYPSQAVCDRSGLKKEGVLRQAEWLYDHYVDLTMNGVLRTEWKEQRSGAQLSICSFSHYFFPQRLSQSQLASGSNIGWRLLHIVWRRLFDSSRTCSKLG
jgi:hypothetical protein